MSYFPGKSPSDAGRQEEKFVWSPGVDSINTNSSPISEVTSSASRSKNLSKYKNVSRPWRHSISHHHFGFSPDAPPTTSTVRNFRPGRQRLRLFVAAGLQWLVTVFFCLILGLCLWGFSQLLIMEVWQVKMFNALIVLASLWLGNNLSGSLKDYALMARWRFLGMNYRPLHEADLLMHCESLRKVFKLLWIARPASGWGLSVTQICCIIWLGINLCLAVLVALLGLTYNLETALYPELRWGLVSIANLTTIRDVWGSDSPSYDAQLGAANAFGIQGQDYNFTDGPVPGQGTSISAFGSPYTPNIYAFYDWTEMRYYFMDLNIENPNISVLSRRYVAVHGNCTQYPLVSGGNGTETYVSYVDPTQGNKTVVLDVVRVGPGATTYISAVNSTCGSRCTNIFVLQSAGVSFVPEPSFYSCHCTIDEVQGIDFYTQSSTPNSTALREQYELSDQSARIMAGAIGWTGFEHSANDNYQYVRYPFDSWWSPTDATNSSQIAGHIMEFAIEAIAALDNNGDRILTQGWYPVPSQVVSVEWKWAGTLLGLIPGLHLLAMIAVCWWAGKVIIRDESCISVAKLWRPVLSKMGEHGCLLTGEEICEALGNPKVKYGVSQGGIGHHEHHGHAHGHGHGHDGRAAGSNLTMMMTTASRERDEQQDEDVARGLRFVNDIVTSQVRHVGMIEEEEGDTSMEGNSGVRRMSVWQRQKVEFPAGLYDGAGYAEEEEWLDDEEDDYDGRARRKRSTAVATGYVRRDEVTRRKLKFRKGRRRDGRT